MAMRDLRERREIRDVAERVADALAEHRLGARVDQALELRGVRVVGESHLDAELRQRVCEEVVGAAVERPGAHDVVALAGDGHERVGHGGAA